MSTETEPIRLVDVPLGTLRTVRVAVVGPGLTGRELADCYARIEPKPDYCLFEKQPLSDREVEMYAMDREYLGVYESPHVNLTTRILETSWQFQEEGEMLKFDYSNYCPTEKHGTPWYIRLTQAQRRKLRAARRQQRRNRKQHRKHS